MVFPNPVDRQINFVLANRLQSKSQLSIRNALGIEVLNMKFEDLAQHGQQISVTLPSSISPGVHFIKIYDQTEQYYTGKILVKTR